MFKLFTNQTAARGNKSDTHLQPEERMEEKDNERELMGNEWSQRQREMTQADQRARWISLIHARL